MELPDLPNLNSQMFLSPRGKDKNLIADTAIKRSPTNEYLILTLSPRQHSRRGSEMYDTKKSSLNYQEIGLMITGTNFKASHQKRNEKRYAYNLSIRDQINQSQRVQTDFGL